MAAAVYAVTAIIFVVFGDANLQSWGSSGQQSTQNYQNSITSRRNGKVINNKKKIFNELVNNTNRLIILFIIIILLIFIN